MRRTVPIFLALALTSVSVAGCWPFGGDEPTPQQKFMEALGRGQSAQASRIWLEMTPEERVAFSRSEGLKPAADPQKVQEDVIRRFMMKSGQVSSDVGVEQITPPTGGGLQELPRYLNDAPSSTSDSPRPQ
ncbi:MAG: hypothetical protein ACREQB_13555 [Candidatus Binataceae bacterium]